jgi:aspartate racemase
MTTTERVLGVLGGMGPAATADFLAKLVAVTDVVNEQDHLRVLVDSNPKVPDRNRALAGSGESPGPALAAMALGLQRAGATLLVMACNTAHAFESAIRDAIDVPFVSIVTETCDAVEREHPKASRVGLLAAQGALDAGLYQSAFAARGHQVLLLGAEKQRDFMGLLYRIKRGDVSPAVRATMRALAESLVADGADVVIAACTEVPLVVDEGELSRPLLDPTTNLARRCVRYARGLEPLPPSSLPRH